MDPAEYKAIFQMNSEMRDYVQRMLKGHPGQLDFLKAITDDWKVGGTQGVTYMWQDDPARSTTPVRTAMMVFQSKEGDCNEVSALVVAEAREAGISAFLAYVTENEQGESISHACAAVFVRGEVPEGLAYGKFETDAGFRARTLATAGIEESEGLHMVLIDPVSLSKQMGNQHREVELLGDRQALSFHLSDKAGTISLLSPHIFSEVDGLLKGAVALNPDNYNAWVQRGDLYLRLADGKFTFSKDFTEEQKKPFYEHAISYYSTALGLEPRIASAYVGMGGAFEKLGDSNSAIDAYKRGAAAVPDSYAMHKALGALYYRLGDRQKALEQYETAANKLKAGGHLDTGVVKRIAEIRAEFRQPNIPGKNHTEKLA